jgi:FkbM family methyltransferase
MLLSILEILHTIIKNKGFFMKRFLLFFLSLQLSCSILPRACHQFLKQFIQPGDLVFDVGAHIGSKTELYRACGARVVCVEPQPNCCAILHKKFDTDSCVVIEPYGLASRPGTLPLAICSESSTISTFSQQWQKEGRFFEHGYAWDKHILVPMTTLDILIERYGVPQFCKIDVENFEYEVLQGLSQTITFISFEFAIETIANTALCVTYLKNLGYDSFNFTIGNDMAFALDLWICADDIIAALRTCAQTRDWSSLWGLWGDVYAHYNS